MDQPPESMEDKIESNKRRIASLTEELKSSSRSKDIKIAGHEDKIKALEKEIRDLKEKNKELLKQLQEIKLDNKTMDKRIKELEKDKEIQKTQKYFEDSVLIIGGISSTIQRNMCKYVLGERVKSWHHNFKKIDEYIEEDLELSEDQEKARQRLEESKEKISWKQLQRWADSLRSLCRTRIDIAHPELSGEKIQQATEFLREKEKLDEEGVKNIEKLKEQWEISEALLRASSAEPGQEQNNARNPPTRLNQGTDTSKANGGPLCNFTCTKIPANYLCGHGN